MKRFLVGVMLVVAGVAYADRDDVWSAASVQVQSVVLNLLPDGGCSVQALATYSKSDGGTVTESSAFAEVSGANQTTCLNIVNVRALALFKSDKGL